MVALCLVDLPPELLFMVADYLDPASLSSLSRSAKHLHAALIGKLHLIALTYTCKLSGCLTTGLGDVIFYYGERKRGTVLEWAAIHDRTFTFKSLLKKPKVDIYLRDLYGNTLLHLLAGQGKTVLMKLLLEAGANVSERNISGFTPLHFAAGRGFTDAVQLLIDEGADISANQIRDLGRDFWDMSLFNRGADTPLHYAANNGHMDVLRLLVEAGADVDAPSQRGRTAASSVSVISGMADVLEYLMELGARTPPAVRVLARMRRSRENWID